MHVKHSWYLWLRGRNGFEVETKMCLTVSRQSGMMVFLSFIDLLYTYEPHIEALLYQRWPPIWRKWVTPDLKSLIILQLVFVWRCLTLNIVDLLERKFACQDYIIFLLIYMHSCFSRKLLFYLFIIYLLVY